jgi:limonene-1,2-epoxide hydrolase
VRRLLALWALLVVAAAGSGAATAAGQAAPPAQVVRAWSHALNLNRNAAAGALFARNARVVQPGVDAVLTSRALATAFNASLPCAGKIIAIRVTGSTALATFVLGHRPQHKCDAPGGKAAAVFVVRNGKIVLWQQVPVPANSGPTA